jgi:hypothetical protein
MKLQQRYLIILSGDISYRENFYRVEKIALICMANSGKYFAIMLYKFFWCETVFFRMAVKVIIIKWTEILLWYQKEICLLHPSVEVMNLRHLLFCSDEFYDWLCRTRQTLTRRTHAFQIGALWFSMVLQYLYLFNANCWRNIRVYSTQCANIVTRR